MSGFKPALGKSSPIFTAMGKRLVAEGCGRYKEGPGPKLGQADVDSYEAFQRKLGYTGSARQVASGPDVSGQIQGPEGLIAHQRDGGLPEVVGQGGGASLGGDPEPSLDQSDGDGPLR
ncbi:peptidoglycan-binding protein [Streptomyces sp. NPDC058676]|uniref:peptidoglycan-binding protein n=1 Tax=unclassified Streptomyces TaxID=2593676 RepID=UPI00366013AE